MLWFLCLKNKLVHCYGKFDSKIIRLITNGIYHPDLVYDALMFQSGEVVGGGGIVIGMFWCAF